VSLNQLIKYSIRAQIRYHQHSGRASLTKREPGRAASTILANIPDVGKHWKQFITV